MRAWILLAFLSGGGTAASAQTCSADLQIAQTLIGELRELDANGQRVQEMMLSGLKASIEQWVDQKQRCQADQVDAESQLRVEQAKMNEFQDQLDKLDQILAGIAGR